MTWGSQEGSGDEPEPALRGGGLPLPGLKRWRLRRGLSRAKLARRADLTPDYLFKVESGRRGCNPEAAQHLADLLRVDLQDLRRKHDGAKEAQAASTEETKAALRSARPRIAFRHVHQAYLKILLVRAVGSSYAAMDEWAIEKHCEESPWEEILEAVRARRREIGFLGEALKDMGGLQEDPDLPAEVRSFLKAVLEGYPDLDIRLLAAARRREGSEEGRRALTKAMRDLL